MEGSLVPQTQYHACGGRIIGVTATRSGTLVTVRLLGPRELPVTEAWVGQQAELLVFGLAGADGRGGGHTRS